MTTSKTTKARRVLAGRKAKYLGERCELMALAECHRRGWLVQRIATPCTVIRGRKVYTGKVVGDIVGVTDTGRALLIECKCHADGRRPVPSDFMPHQRDTLLAWDRAGALVLVAWVSKAGMNMAPASSLFA